MKKKLQVTDIITFLNIIYKFPKDKNRDEFISKIRALNISELNIELLRLDFVSNIISNQDIKNGLKNVNTAFPTIQLLTNKNMPFEIEDDSIAWAALHNFYDIKKTNSVSFISKRTTDYNKEKIVFYFYSVKEKEDTSFTKDIKTIAFFMKGNQINPSAFTSLYNKTIQEDDNLEEKLEAIIKEYLNSNHLRASYEKEEDENYIPNYLYDDY